MMKETEMAHIVITSPGKIWEQTVAAREKKARSLRWVARLLRLWRRACMVIADWDSRALQREKLAQLNDHMLADIGLTREKPIVDASRLFCLFPFP
jgi:uncharacterized protein YjiS (DUF1127 family)